METLLSNVLALRRSSDSDRYRLAGAELIKAISIEPPVAHRVLRFLFRECQTRDEQVRDETIHRNGRGFDNNNPKHKHALARKHRLTAKELEEASKIAIHFIEQVPRHATEDQIREIMLGPDASWEAAGLPQKKKRATLEDSDDEEESPTSSANRRVMRGPKGFITFFKRIIQDSSEDEEDPTPKRRAKRVARDPDEEEEPAPKRRAKRVARDPDEEEEPTPKRRAKRVARDSAEEQEPAAFMRDNATQDAEEGEQVVEECEADAVGVTGPSVRVLSPLAMDVYEEALRSLSIDLERPRVSAADVLREMALQEQITLFDVHLALCLTLRRVTPQAGDSVMVLWPGMGCWYQGTIMALRPGAVKVHYTDGDIEWVVDRCQWMYVCNKA